MRLCIHASTLLKKNISKASWPVLIKFHKYHQWGGGGWGWGAGGGGVLAVLGFGANLVRILISTPTKTSHRHKSGENVVRTIATSFLIQSISNLQLTRTGIKISNKIDSGQLAWDLPTFKGPILGKCCLDDSDFMCYQIFIRLAGTSIKSWTSQILGQIRLFT